MKKNRDKEIVYKNYKDALIVKGNNLIMSRYNLSLAEQRLILQVVSMISKDDEDFKNYTIRVADYLDLINSNSPNTYQKIKEFAETLLKKPLHIPQDDGGFFVCNWFAGLKYEPKKGVLVCSFHPNLKPYLLQLKKNFTSYKLKNILSLSSKYSIRLYEILKRYEGMGVAFFDLNEFRELLSIPESYFYKNIKQRILKPLQREFKNYTDISFDFEEIKSNKRIVAIKFTIKSNLKTFNNKKQEDIDNQGSLDVKVLELFDLLPNKKRTMTAQKIFSYYLKSYDVNYIRKQIEYVNKQNPNNYFAYLKRAIEEDYADYKKVEIEIMRQQKIFEKLLFNLEKERKHSIEVALDKEKSSIFKEYMGLLNDEDKKELLDGYLQKAKDLYPDVDEKSFEMEFKIEQLIIEDIISKNEIYQIRLSKAKERAQKQADIEYEQSRISLYNKLKSGLL
ncbi:replication initiation protein [Desulfurella sp.]|uniref:replication initiation protein n=1 Tax=Desulfurella sp. TaxID=1962857 RepID=UPI00257FB7FA|nr:replication initiation protein [Desulfurella sp.]